LKCDSLRNALAFHNYIALFIHGFFFLRGGVKKKPRNMWGWIVLFFVLLIMGVLFSWIYISYQTFPHFKKPGDRYIIAGREYHIPHLPHKTFGSYEKARLNRPVPMLSAQMLRDLRELVNKSVTALDDASVVYWVTGGTLLSAVKWGHLMCYDDDADVSVRWEDREYIWSDKFATLLSLHGLEVFYLRGCDTHFATREGSVVRVRLRGHIVPTLDIFVTKRVGNKWAKVNTWSGDALTYEATETWDADWLFPLQYVEIDGMRWSLPHRPERMLDQQYSPQWRTEIQSPRFLTKSHVWIFWISNKLGVWRTATLKSYDNKDELRQR
jgi:hypothetical protein